MSEILKSDPDLVFIPEDGEYMIFDPKTGGIKLLNETGAIIFQLLDGKHDRKSIIEELYEKFDGVSKDVILDDLESFLAEMKKDQLLVGDWPKAM